MLDVLTLTSPAPKSTSSKKFLETDNKASLPKRKVFQNSQPEITQHKSVAFSMAFKTNP